MDKNKPPKQERSIIAPRELRFVSTLFRTIPRNQTAAYMEVYNVEDMNTAGVAASKLMQKPYIIAEVEKWDAMLKSDLQMDIAALHREAFLIANADPRELTDTITGSCRYCHGEDHKFHRTPAEYERDLDKHIDQCQAIGKPDPLGLLFKVQGGIGFNKYRAPHPECPECFGEGVLVTRFKDSRDLSPGAARLFAGVKETRNGIEIITRNQDKMLDLIGDIIGAKKKGLELSGPGGAPLTPAVISVTDPQEASIAYQSIMKAGGG